MDASKLLIPFATSIVAFVSLRILAVVPESTFFVASILFMAILAFLAIKEWIFFESALFVALSRAPVVAVTVHAFKESHVVFGSLSIVLTFIVVYAIDERDKNLVFLIVAIANIILIGARVVDNAINHSHANVGLTSCFRLSRCCCNCES